MSLLDIYYQFEKLENGKSKTRRELVSYSEIYDRIHYKNKKNETWIYLSEKPQHIKANERRNFELSISNGKGEHISGVIIPDPEKAGFGYGDVNGTLDAILFVLGDDNRTIEIFISKGKKNTSQNLYFLLCDGELDSEMQSLREKAKVL
ncbi:MAG: hypothetical protein CV087_22535 [Candidatus Brocadia sp. WS118]|nr:MAG: hypothetical protein CV087_22535 [Candidatus Brocadia sp. WS118]